MLEEIYGRADNADLDLLAPAAVQEALVGIHLEQIGVGGFELGKREGTLKISEEWGDTLLSFRVPLI